MLPRSLDPRDLARPLPGFAHGFGYRLHARDFHSWREADSNASRGC
jgi:hypothetical protein